MHGVHETAVIDVIEKYDAQMREKIEGILYPGLPAGARQSYITAHGCSAWTEPALRSIEAVSARGGVVELGAGSGHWARALRSRGLDVVAFDDLTSPSFGVAHGVGVVLLLRPALAGHALLAAQLPGHAAVGARRVQLPLGKDLRPRLPQQRREASAAGAAHGATAHGAGGGGRRRGGGCGMVRLAAAAAAAAAPSAAAASGPVCRHEPPPVRQQHLSVHHKRLEVGADVPGRFVRLVDDQDAAEAGDPK